MVFTAVLFFADQGIRLGPVYVTDFVLVSGLFVVPNVGFAGANALYDSLLPHVTDDEGIDRLSAAGYALGYFGGGILVFSRVDVEEGQRLARYVEERGELPDGDPVAGSPKPGD